MKRLALLVATALVALSITGCTTTKTVSTTDANGNTTTTTTVSDKSGETTTTEVTDAAGDTVSTETSNSEESEFITATIEFDNLTGADIQEIYFSANDETEWGEDILGENAPLANGEALTITDGFNYNESCLVWDMRAVDVEGTAIDFTGLDMSYAADSYSIIISLEYSEEDGYVAIVK